VRSLILQLKTIIELTLECVENIAALSSQKECRDVVKKFRSRARETPTYAFTNGLAYVITLLAARSSRNVVEHGFMKVGSCSDIVNKVISERGALKDEELSYGLYGAILVYIIKKADLIASNNFGELVREALNNSTLDVKVRPVFEWIKRFAEAYIESE